MSEQTTIGPGWVRHHHDELGSTNDEARRLAQEGAPHGTTVTAESQTAGRGRQGRAWTAPRGQGLTASFLLRGLDRPGLLPLAAGVAVADVVGPAAQLKWPNDVVLVGRDRPDAPPAGDGLRKLAGILAEGRPAEDWAIVGIGLNVAIDLAALPEDVARRAATLGRTAGERDAVLDALAHRLDEALALAPDDLLQRWAERDALRGRDVRWTALDGSADHGRADGVDADGRLRIVRGDGSVVTVDAGEVHLAVGA
ncbi:biotin--[acetyl-CoA-carboxylase] ligase [Patulibacter brassicae]|jgi:BirA family biotin operon repressor/biotin-[acetyl-CoA-carboxylase] ligase|uniref:biotin--[biotin carboxyl-carrier protein] ligase n=1 Tax=Patulibacter brassicae TaxID=1705717 RepID=A0ABU4VLC5_9ACTN|nr:biotin--[acetyl-CoA-carboxylase] ligase [Patulibacter brassicae]MDX8152623.1 biotin--[acetyl-CoA-carboxylase] ligase [Patulibacter brassicae]